MKRKRGGGGGERRWGGRGGEMVLNHSERVVIWCLGLFLHMILARGNTVPLPNSPPLSFHQLVPLSAFQFSPPSHPFPKTKPIPLNSFWGGMELSLNPPTLTLNPTPHPTPSPSKKARWVCSNPDVEILALSLFGGGGGMLGLRVRLEPELEGSWEAGKLKLEGGRDVRRRSKRILISFRG